MNTSRPELVHENRGRIMRNAAWYLAAGLGSHAYVLVSLPLLQRTLSAAEFGVYVILAQVAMMLQMAMTALFGSAILRLRIEYEGSQQKSFLFSVLTSATLVQAMVWALLAWRGEETLATIYPNLTLDLGIIPTLFGAWTLLLTLRSLTTTLIKSLEVPRNALILNLLYGIALLVALWIMLVLQPGKRGVSGTLTDAFWAFLFAEASSTVLVCYFLRRHVSLSARMHYLWAALKFTGPLVLGSILFAVVLNLDGIILAHYVDLETQGIYGFGAVLGKASAAVVTAYISSYSARLINSSINQPRVQTAALLQNIMSDNLAILGAFTCTMLLVAETLIAITMSNPSYGIGSDASASWLAVWSLSAICVGNLSRSVFQVYYNTLFLVKRTWLMLGLNLLLLMTTAVVMVAGAEIWEARGVALGLAISYLVLSFLAARPARERFDWTFPWRLGLRTYFTVGLGLIGTFFISLFEYSHTDIEFWAVKTLQGLLCLSWLPTLIALHRAAIPSKEIGPGSSP